jgi:hypothetical protein
MMSEDFLWRGGALRARQKKLQLQIIGHRRQPEGRSAIPTLCRELDDVTNELAALIAAYTNPTEANQCPPLEDHLPSSGGLAS